MCMAVGASAQARRKSKVFRCIVSLLGQRNTFRSLFLLLLLLLVCSKSVSSLLLWNFCSEISHRSGKLWITEIVLWWPLSVCGAPYTAVSRFLGARKSIGATDLCWKNMWCLEQERHLSCQRYQRRMKLNWNVQAFLVISGSLTFYSAPLRKELCGWISLSWMG